MKAGGIAREIGQDCPVKADRACTFVEALRYQERRTNGLLMALLGRTGQR